MEPSLDARARELWELIHAARLPIRAAAARLGISVTEAYELLAREKLRRDERLLKQPPKFTAIFSR